MAQLVSIKSFKPDMIFVPGYYSEGGLIAKQAKQVGLSGPLLGGDGWDSQQLWGLGGTSLNGSYIANHYASDNPSPANKAFVAKYKLHHEGREPDTFAALGYDAVKLLADAIGRAGTTDGPAIREALATTRNFEGVTGRITIDENRNALKAAVILRLQDGRFVYFDTVERNETSAPAKPPDLSGTWVLDEAKSNIGRRRSERVSNYTLSIVHQGPEIRMSKRFEQGGRVITEEVVYYTDGRPEYSSLRRVRDPEPVTRWRGNRLVRRSVKESSGSFKIKFETQEEWVLSEDAMTLTRTVLSSGPGLILRTKFVFTRLS
jgi:hypothetical protein